MVSENTEDINTIFLSIQRTNQKVWVFSCRSEQWTFE